MALSNSYYMYCSTVEYDTLPSSLYDVVEIVKLTVAAANVVEIENVIDVR